MPSHNLSRHLSVAGLTQHQLSIKSGVAASTVSRYCAGLRMTDAHRATIAAALGVKAETLR